MIFKIPYFLKRNDFLVQLDSRYSFDSDILLYFSFYDFNIICLYNEDMVFNFKFFNIFCGAKEKLVFRLRKLDDSRAELETIIYLTPNNKGNVILIKKLVSFLRKNGIKYRTNSNYNIKNKKDRNPIHRAIYFYFAFLDDGEGVQNILPIFK